MAERKVLGHYMVEIVEETDGRIYVEGTGEAGPFGFIPAVPLPSGKTPVGISEAMKLVGDVKHVADTFFAAKQAPTTPTA